MIARKLHTLVTNPERVFRKYTKRLYDLCGVYLPLFDEDYDSHWNYLPLKGKRILDLGADYGSTAYYFLLKGAKQVIAVEGDQKLASQLKRHYADTDRVIPIHKFINCPNDITNLISQFHPDLIKMDIESYEKHLLDCPNQLIQNINEWMIECHSEEITQRLKQKFLHLNFKVTTIPYYFKSKGGSIPPLPHINDLFILIAQKS
jgi:hypothetical protein